MANTDDVSYQTTIAIMFAISIASIAVSLRSLTREIGEIAFGADCYLMVVGVVSS